jgi:hypothetical protein
MHGTGALDWFGWSKRQYCGIVRPNIIHLDGILHAIEVETSPYSHHFYNNVDNIHYTFHHDQKGKNCRIY